MVSVYEQTMLPVMEQFYTLQGEGHYQGNAAYFIRLGGCDVGCVWCDVKESWEADKHPRQTISQLVDAVLQTPATIVVITGGEPLMHKLDALTQQLRKAGLRCHLETSGAHPISGEWDWICLSPKKFKAPLAACLPLANELKVVIYHSSDLLWADQHAAQVSSTCKLYLQPEWDRAQKVTPLIVEKIKSEPRWQLSLQVHKYIHVP
ncbi:MAG: 7-carboxy-7-deazaguanine synthase QueE [Sphingomonadales bacterium]